MKKKIVSLYLFTSYFAYCDETYGQIKKIPNLKSTQINSNNGFCVPLNVASSPRNWDWAPSFLGFRRSINTVAQSHATFCFYPMQSLTLLLFNQWLSCFNTLSSYYFLLLTVFTSFLLLLIVFLLSVILPFFIFLFLKGPQWN